MTSEANFHVLIASQIPHWERIPRFQRGALSPTGSRHVVLRANFDRKNLANHHSLGSQEKVTEDPIRLHGLVIGIFPAHFSSKS